jgi:hypothetical protein
MKVELPAQGATVADLVRALLQFPADLEVEVGYDGDMGTTYPYEVQLRAPEIDGDDEGVRIVCP